MRMPFGKHKGREVATLPKKYLRWVERYCNMNLELYHEIEWVLTGKLKPTPKETVEEIVQDFETQLLEQ